MITSTDVRAFLAQTRMTQVKLAELVGVTQPTVSRWLRGSNPEPQHQDVLQQILADQAGGAAPPKQGYRPPQEFFGSRDLPVYSAVEGGPGEMVVSTDPIDHVVRPWFLGNVKEGYAVVVTGESMLPVYEPGDLVIVNPRLPPVKGRNFIFVSGEENGEFLATVKRLEKITPSDWHVRQWNPPEGMKSEFTLSRKRWPKALRIVGKYEGY